MYSFENNILKELNDESLYYEGFESINRSLEISRSLNRPIEKPYNIFVYWIGNNLNHKHEVVLKSFLATQNLLYARLKIYSDRDLSETEIFQKYHKFEQIEFNIFDVDIEVKNTDYENFKYLNQIKNHEYNAAYESDFFRLLMLHKYGGFYIDFDVLILRDLSPLLDYDFLYQWGYYPNKMINGAIMHLKKDSKPNRLLTEKILCGNPRPGVGSLNWASDLYIQIKQMCEELIIFPASFFNPEWQAGRYIKHEPFRAVDYIELFDGCFTWHWHNRWNDEIENGSKFHKLEMLIEKKLKEKYDDYQ